MASNDVRLSMWSIDIAALSLILQDLSALPLTLLITSTSWPRQLDGTSQHAVSARFFSGCIALTALFTLAVKYSIHLRTPTASPKAHGPAARVLVALIGTLWLPLALTAYARVHDNSDLCESLALRQTEFDLRNDADRIMLIIQHFPLWLMLLIHFALVLPHADSQMSAVASVITGTLFALVVLLCVASTVSQLHLLGIAAVGWLISCTSLLILAHLSRHQYYLRTALLYETGPTAAAGSNSSASSTSLTTEVDLESKTALKDEQRKNIDNEQDVSSQPWSTHAPLLHMSYACLVIGTTCIISAGLIGLLRLSDMQFIDTRTQLALEEIRTAALPLSDPRLFNRIDATAGTASPLRMTLIDLRDIGQQWWPESKASLRNDSSPLLIRLEAIISLRASSLSQNVARFARALEFEQVRVVPTNEGTFNTLIPLLKSNIDVESSLGRANNKCDMSLMMSETNFVVKISITKWISRSQLILVCIDITAVLSLLITYYWHRWSRLFDSSTAAIHYWDPISISHTPLTTDMHNGRHVGTRGLVQVRGSDHHKTVVGSFIDDTSMDEETRAFITRQFSTAQVDRRPSKLELVTLLQVKSLDRKVRMKRGPCVSVGEDGVSDIVAINSLNVSAAGIDSFDYDPTVLGMDELRLHVRYMLSQHPVVKENFAISHKRLANFVTAVSDDYVAANPYHNFNHGVDVLQFVYRLLSVTDVCIWLNPVHVLSLLVAAIGHDIKHGGLNNQYLVSSRHELATLYNDKSPLENMHASRLFELMQQDSLNILECLPNAQEKRVARGAIIGAILATDMVHHFQLVEKLQELQSKFKYMHGGLDGECSIFHNSISLSVEGPSNVLRQLYFGGGDEDESEHENQSELFLELFIHSADIGNQLRGGRVAQKWAGLVMDEFFLQGDQEREDGLAVSALFDREKTNVNQTQCNFISYVVAPLAAEFLSLFPTSCAVLGENIVANNQMWLDKYATGADTCAGTSAPVVFEAMREQVKRVEGLMTTAVMLG